MYCVSSFYLSMRMVQVVGFEVGLMRWVIVITSWAALTTAFAQVLGVSVPALGGPIATKAVICLTFAVVYWLVPNTKVYFMLILY